MKQFALFSNIPERIAYFNSQVLNLGIEFSINKIPPNCSGVFIFEDALETIKEEQPHLFKDHLVWILSSKKHIPQVIKQWGHLCQGFLSSDPLEVNWIKALTEVALPFSSEKTFTLKNSQEKSTTLNELELFLSQFHFNSQIARKVLDTADELIMNAFFDAPLNEQKQQMYHQLSRDALVFAPQENPIFVNISIIDKMIKLSVKDPHGTMNKDKLIYHLGQNFESEEYHPRQDYAGAGLGLWGAVKSGASVCFKVTPQQSTEVIAFFPMTDSFLEYKKMSQLVSFDFKQSA